MADLLENAVALRKRGFAVHRLKPQTKRPIGDDWSDKPVMSVADLQKEYRPGENIGVRLGEPSVVDGEFLHCIDLDIRDTALADEAMDALKRLLPEVETLPTVISGSGGKSRHFYLTADKAFRSRKLAHSDQNFVGQDGKKHWAWEIELFGTGKQVVLPPSIHPDTKKPYRWEREFDAFEAPTVDSRLVESWGASSRGVDSDDDLDSLVRKQTLGMSADEARDILAGLPYGDWCDDRDGWLKVGMALHHEFGGDDEGFNLWCEFSKQSPKFNRADQKRVWRSFDEEADALVRMATLVKAAAQARLEREMYGEAADEFDLPSSDDEFDLPTSGEEPTSQKKDDWTKRLEFNTSKDAWASSLHNLTLILHNDPRTAGVIAYNQFTQQVVVRKSPGRKLKLGKHDPIQLDEGCWCASGAPNGSNWHDANDASLRRMLETPIKFGGYGLRVTDRDLTAAIRLVSEKNGFHPVREYLNGLRWDGAARLDTAFIRYLGSEDNAYTREVTRLVFLGGVTRIFQPGHKFDFVAILEGIQGKRKSTFIEKMAKSWFEELPPEFSNPKAMVEVMQGSWILEIPELSGFARAEVQDIKAFISDRCDKIRLAYDRRASEFPRQCIFVGSTNDSEYLKDQTGGRRFWPIACTVAEIDIDGFEDEVDQLWAEAVHLYRRLAKQYPPGKLPLYLRDDEAKRIASVEQEARRAFGADEELAGLIASWLDQPVTLASLRRGTSDKFDAYENGEDNALVLRNTTCAMEIWTELLGKDPAHYDQKSAIQIGRAMKAVPGWEYVSTKRHVREFKNQKHLRRFGSTSNADWTPAPAEADEFDL